MALLTYAQALLDCTYVTLTEAGFPPCTHYLAASPTPAIDNCCICSNGSDGQLWVSLVSTQPRDPFRGQPCGRDFQVEFTIGLTRCTASLKDDGAPPTPAEIQAAAEKMYRDRDLVLKAITCCFAEEFDLDPEQWAIGQFSSLPNQGGCQVFTQGLLLRTSDCSQC